MRNPDGLTAPTWEVEVTGGAILETGDPIYIRLTGGSVLPVAIVLVVTRTGGNTGAAIAGKHAKYARNASPARARRPRGTPRPTPSPTATLELDVLLTHCKMTVSQR